MDNKKAEKTINTRIRRRAHKKLRIRAAKEGKTLLDLLDEFAGV
jgi:predicted HicB family RNase H-like nuclease